MEMLERIRKQLISIGKSESELCSFFSIASMDKIPLVRLEEVARFLELSRFELLCLSKLKKDFPQNIRLLILDVDGVLTDGGMYFTENGDQAKKYNTKDGMGILYLTNNDFQVGIISSGFTGDMVKRRADMLRIQHFYLGREPKLNILKQWCEKLKINLSQVAMIGDDVNDLELMQQIGFSACPSDAVSAIKEQADCILSKKGGEGCVREFIDDIMQISVSF